jgi:hypothetical protein
MLPQALSIACCSTTVLSVRTQSQFQNVVDSPSHAEFLGSHFYIGSGATLIRSCQFQPDSQIGSHPRHLLHPKPHYLCRYCEFGVSDRRRVRCNYSKFSDLFRWYFPFVRIIDLYAMPTRTRRVVLFELHCGAFEHWWPALYRLSIWHFQWVWR